jgi:hypothetical protein
MVAIAARYITANVGGAGATECKSKSENLPPGSTAGIECIGDYVVDVGGYYLYPSPDKALETYSAVLAQYGLSLGSGNCAGGESGDSAWWVPQGFSEQTSPWRIGCFMDAKNAPNLRLVCHAGTAENPTPVIYLVLVGFDDIAGLYKFAVGSPQPGHPPRLCDSNGDQNE